VRRHVAALLFLLCVFKIGVEKQEALDFNSRVKLTEQTNVIPVDNGLKKKAVMNHRTPKVA
jgi:hypothetical protein